MKKLFSTALCLIAAEIIAVALTILAAHVLSIYSFGGALTVKNFITLAAGFALVTALLALVIYAVNRNKAFLSKAAVIALPFIFAASEGLSYLILKLIGVIKWTRLGSTYETEFVPMLIFTAVSIVISLALSVIIASIAERKGAKK